MNLIEKILKFIHCNIFFLKRKNVKIETIDDIYKFLKIKKKCKSYLLWVPVEKVCMHGAFRYGNGWHPFIGFIEKGISNLEVFYKNFNPKNLAQMYFFNEENMDKGMDLPVWELPWVSRKIMREPAAEGGLSVEKHGVSYFGPVSSEKLAFESKRLTTTLNSIKKTGYKPEDEINGFFMEHENDFVFFVRGGKHRTAVLSFLRYKKIPVVIRDGWQPIYHSKDVKDWELVKLGKVSESFALKVYVNYFINNGIFQFNKINNYE